MELTVNNQAIETTACTLSELAIELALPKSGIAIAVDNRMIPQTEWDDYRLKEEVKIIIIKAVCGG